MRTSAWGTAVAAGAVVAVAAACGSGRGGPEASPPEAAPVPPAETRTCEATLVLDPFEAHTGADPTRGGGREVLVRLGPASHGSGLSLASAGEALGAGPAGRIRELSLPDTVAVRWEAEVRAGPEGAGTGWTPRAYLAVRSATVRERGQALYRYTYPAHSASRLLAARCGADERVRVPLPRRVLVRVTSDPTGASLFRPPAPDRPGGFLGTTPRDVELFWLPGDRPVTLRVEKSGYHTVHERVYPADEERRIVLRPLPRGR